MICERMFLVASEVPPCPIGGCDSDEGSPGNAIPTNIATAILIRRRRRQMGPLRPFWAKFPNLIAFSAKLKLNNVLVSSRCHEEMKFFILSSFVCVFHCFCSSSLAKSTRSGEGIGIDHKQLKAVTIFITSCDGNLRRGPRETCKRQQSCQGFYLVDRVQSDTSAKGMSS